MAAVDGAEDCVMPAVTPERAEQLRTQWRRRLAADFRLGDVVDFSPEGEHLRTPKLVHARGMVVGFGVFYRNSVRVKWTTLKNVCSYHEKFLRRVVAEPLTWGDR